MTMPAEEDLLGIPTADLFEHHQEFSRLKVVGTRNCTGRKTAILFPEVSSVTGSCQKPATGHSLDWGGTGSGRS